MRATKANNTDNSLMVTVDQLQEKLNCGYQTAVKIGEQAQARIFVGRRVWYSVKKIEEYLYKNSV